MNNITTKLRSALADMNRGSRALFDFKTTYEPSRRNRAAGHGSE